MLCRCYSFASCFTWNALFQTLWLCVHTVMCLWSTISPAAEIRIKRDNMRSAEAKLLDMARRFSPCPDPSNTDAATNNAAVIQVFDTPIPAMACLSSKHNKRNRGGDDVSNSDDLLIHGIHVSSSNAKSNCRPEMKSTPLVLLHGYAGAAATYHRNFMGLSEYFSTIYSLDWLGWGLSSRPPFSFTDNTSIETAESFFVDSLEAWRAKHNIEKMILAAHSIGGYLSVAYCEKYPDRVQRLILISPAGTPEETDDANGRLQEMIGTAWSRKMALSVYRYLYRRGRTIGEVVRALPKKSGLQRVIKFVDRFPAISDEEERMTLATYLYYNLALPGSGEYCVNRFLNHFAFAKHPTIHRIPKLQVEHVTFVYGDRDFVDIETGGLAVQRVCAEKQQSSLEQLTPNVTVFCIHDAGHAPPWDNWEEFNAAIILGSGYAKDDLSKNSPIPTKAFFQNKSLRRSQSSRFVQMLTPKPDRSSDALRIFEGQCYQKQEIIRCYLSDKPKTPHSSFQFLELSEHPPNESMYNLRLQQKQQDSSLAIKLLTIADIVRVTNERDHESLLGWNLDSFSRVCVV